MEILAIIGSILAVAISALSVWYTRKHWRAADELVKIERARRADEEVAADRLLVDFKLVARGKDAHRLINDGTGTAYGVRVQLEGPNRGPEEIAEFPPGHQEQYLVFHKRRPTTVTWHQQPDLSDQARTITLYP